MEIQEVETIMQKEPVHISDLPEEILEHILRQLSPYQDMKSAMLTCRQWHRLVLGVIQQRYQDFVQGVREGQAVWTEIPPEAGSMITERYSHCSCYFDKSVYVFGGCTSTNTTFNDLWRFDLSTRKWIRPLAVGTYPSPKACASMVVYKDSLVLFGGWSHPTPYPLHQAARFFSELHLYKPEMNRWFHVTTMSPTSPKPTAGHSASVVGDTMVVFGGSPVPGAGTNDVWIFDFIENVWRRKVTGEKKPSPRYGQTQMTVDDTHIIVIGGCGGPNQIFSDVWLLTMNSEPWQWDEVKVIQPENAAPQLWCHPACKVDDMLVVLSKPTRPFPPHTTTDASKTETRSKHSGFQGNKVMSQEDNSFVRGASASPESGRTRQRRYPVSDSDDSSGTESEDSSQGERNVTEFKHPGDVNSSRSRGQVSPSFLRSRGRGRISPNSVQGHFSGAALEDSPRVSVNEEQGSPSASSLRPGPPSIRPNAMKNRQKQLEALRKFEERLRESRMGGVHEGSRNSDMSLDQVPGSSNTAMKDQKSLMHLHVLDISLVVSQHTAVWRPLRENFSPSAPEETIFYSIVEGRGELIIFGGIQRDIQLMQRAMNLKSHVVSNNVYILSPRTHFL